MSDDETCWSNARPEIDSLLRVRLLELQLATVADAVRILAETIDNADTRTDIVQQIEDLLAEARVPHHPQPPRPNRPPATPWRARQRV